MTDVLPAAPVRAPQLHEPVIAAPDQPASSHRWLAWLVLGVLSVGFVAAIVAVSLASAGPDAVRVVVPEGTAQRLDGGGVVEEVERVVHLEPGQALELVNDDSRLHVIGTLRAEQGDTTRQVFTTEGRYVVTTSLRSDGLVTILVEDPDQE